MIYLFFAALIAVAVFDIRRMVTEQEKKPVIAAYAVLMAFAAGVGAVLFYSDLKIWELL